MVKETKTQSFNADRSTLRFLTRVKKYRMSKDSFIREAIYFYYKDIILPFEMNLAKQKRFKDIPF